MTKFHQARGLKNVHHLINFSKENVRNIKENVRNIKEKGLTRLFL